MKIKLHEKTYIFLYYGNDVQVMFSEVYTFFYCLKMLNYFQIQSFETELPVPHIAATEGGPPTFRGVFIRAPAILEVGPEVEVLADFTVQSN